MFFVLDETLKFGKFQSADFKYGTSYFSDSGLKVPKQVISDAKVKVIFTFDKSECADFKYDNSFFNFSPIFTPKDIFGTTFKAFFALDETLKFQKFQSDDFKYGNSFLKSPPKNTQIKQVSPKYKKFLLRVVIANMTKGFSYST